jgi:hypothetical protein
MYRLMQANSIIEFKNNVEVALGDILYDADTTTLWINNTVHTTVATGTFADERFANSSYWTALQLGIQAKGQWQRNTFYPVDSLAYDATEGLAGICIVEHTSPNTGSMRDDADNWVMLIDSGGGGGVPASSVSYDDTTSSLDVTNVQDAIDALDADLGSIDSTVSTLDSTVAGLVTSKGPSDATYLVRTAHEDLSSERIVTDGTHITWDWSATGIVKAVLKAASVTASQIADTTITYAKLATEAVASAAEILSNTANKLVSVSNLWDANVVYNLGNVSGTVTLDFNTHTNFRCVLTGNVTFANPTNLKSGQSFGLFITQDGTGGRTISFGTKWLPVGASAMTYNTAANKRNYISGQYDANGDIIAYSGGKLE